ncbi:hypothetical protein D2T33_17135 [Sinirhodobacter populi]|uniref:Uncharacterized protein n=1 Tax=Paenirhodobacter populi TaxID=2306993 RepID=A0A443INZ5_9RHOB|nr:hypothetical protein D2T33_17135 [Sinirhodobacter populi]
MSKTTNKFSPKVRACRSDGSGQRGPARLVLAGGDVDCGEDWLCAANAERRAKTAEAASGRAFPARCLIA